MALLSWLNARWQWVALLACALAGALVGAFGIGVSFERTIHQADWSLRQHPASGQLHIIEIDARSIAAIDHWPWPRSNYARLIDRLREAGAASIVFDVDFSSRSIPQEDSALAEALDRAGGKVALPTFGQQAGGGRKGWTDSLPIPELRDHATLAAVSILPDADGYVRRAPVGTITDRLPRPSLSAMIAGVNGAAGADFPIDFSIDPASIPRHSFIDIRDGKFDPRTIAGKNLLIGASAIEMGDRYAVPNHGVLPGVVIQALAAETLVRGIPNEAGWTFPLVLALGLAWIVVRAQTRLQLLVTAASGPIILFAAAVLADAVLNRIFPLVPALVSLVLAAAATAVMHLARSARRRRLHDNHSGLPNRHALGDAIRTYRGAGVVAGSIGEFSKLAASLGDAATAEFIRRVRDRIATVAEGETIYRIEDRMLAWRCYDESALETRLATLRTRMLAPIEVAGRRVDAVLTFGFAPEQPGDRPEHIVARAALAADHAIAEGKNWHFHEAEDEDAIDREVSLLGELDEAIGKGEIVVVYQPKLDLRSGRITGVEALVRWNHGTRGFLRPDLFIPFAERHDRIAGLTMHVVEHTIADVLHWVSLGHLVTGAVNLSAKLLTAPGFIAELRGLVDRSGIPPEMLTFEVTESAAMTDPVIAAAALQSFREIGVSISMDDYGTGQSSLSYLKQLPLNELKIDRSFVQFAHQNRSDGALVRSTIDLAHELGLKVVAEGVEDQACLDFLRGIDCDMIQGYLISKPVPAAELAALLPRSYAEAA